MPWADVLYGCDARWWNAHNGTDFQGEKWSSHNNKEHADDKLEVSEKYDLNLIRGIAGEGFSTKDDLIYYGDNSGFQAVNLAMVMGATDIILVGFDMRIVSGRSHFFGDHPKGLFQRKEYDSFAKKFVKPPEGVTIINATPGSAIKAYPVMEFDEAIRHHSLHRNGAEPYARAS